MRHASATMRRDQPAQQTGPNGTAKPRGVADGGGRIPPRPLPSSPMVDAKPTIRALRCMHAQAWPPHVIAYLTGTDEATVTELADRTVRHPGLVGKAYADEVERVATCMRGARGTVVENAARRGWMDLAVKFRQVAPCRVMVGPDKATAVRANRRHWRSFAAEEAAQEEAAAAAWKATASAAGTSPLVYKRARAQSQLDNAKLKLDVLADTLKGIPATQVAARRGLSRRYVLGIRNTVGLSVQTKATGLVHRTEESRANADRVLELLGRVHSGSVTPLDAVRELGFSTPMRGGPDLREKVRAHADEDNSLVVLAVLDGTLQGLGGEELAERCGIHRRTVSRLRNMAGLVMRRGMGGNRVRPECEARAEEVRVLLEKWKSGEATAHDTALALGFFPRRQAIRK